MNELGEVAVKFTRLLHAAEVYNKNPQPVFQMQLKFAMGQVYT